MGLPASFLAQGIVGAPQAATGLSEEGSDERGKRLEAKAGMAESPVCRQADAPV